MSEIGSVSRTDAPTACSERSWYDVSSVVLNEAANTASAPAIVNNSTVRA